MARKAEPIAKRLSRERHGTEAFAELYLLDAYRELTDAQDLKNANNDSG